MRPRLAMLAALAITVLVAGCGGESTIYAQHATANCLTQWRAPVSTSTDDLDYVAQDASGGGIAGDGYTIALGATVNDAKRLEAAYKVFAAALDSPTDDILYRRANAVILWDDTPDDSDREDIEKCLLPKGGSRG